MPRAKETSKSDPHLNALHESESQRSLASSEDQGTESTFPQIFHHMPRFYAIGMVPGIHEPQLISLHSNSYNHKWFLVFTYPGNKFPRVVQSLKVIMNHVEAFSEISCEIFVLVNEKWSVLKLFLKNKLRDRHEITFLLDPERMITNRLGLLGKALSLEGSVIPREHMFAYPGYLLFCPRRDLIQYCVLKDPQKFYEVDGKAFFQYPINDKVMEGLLSNVRSLQPLYEKVESIKRLTNVPFGTLFEAMVRMAEGLEKEEKEEEKGKERKKIFNWNDMGRIFGQGI